jgi:alpha,alpha-trehalase
VDLNSLLYKTEMDLARMASLLERPREAARWRELAAQRQQRMNRYLWDARVGMFYDWNVKEGRRSTYEYASTFYPLWAGLASPEQARAVARNLPSFEQPGGLAMSRDQTGVQWDHPYGWAPIQLLAVEGLRRYGFHSDADRIALKFVTLVAEDFRRNGSIREKYDVVRRTSEVKVQAGYPQNVIGFGWTNGVFLELLHGLEDSPARRPVGRRAPQRPGREPPRAPAP